MDKLITLVRKNIRGFGMTILAVVCSFLVGAVLLAAVGYDPLQAYLGILKGAFGSKTAIVMTLQKTTPLLLTGIAVAIAFKGASFNIGAEGQFYAGALGGALCEMALHHSGLPGVVLIPLCLAAAFVFGAVWGAIPGYMKAVRGSSEVVTSVMLSSVMILFIGYLVQQGGPIAEPRGFYPETEEIVAEAQLPYILGGTKLHAGILVALAVVVLIYLLLEKTTWGYAIKACGQNNLASQYAGISEGSVTIATMALSGAIAGLAGGVELLGTSWKLHTSLSPGYGYNAIAVALLGRLNPAAIVFSALLFGALSTGSNQMARSIGVPSTLASVMQALVLIFVVGFSMIKPRAKKARKKEVADNG